LIVQESFFAVVVAIAWPSPAMPCLATCCFSCHCQQLIVHVQSINGLAVVVVAVCLMPLPLSLPRCWLNCCYFIFGVVRVIGFALAVIVADYTALPCLWILSPSSESVNM